MDTRLARALAFVAAAGLHVVGAWVGGIVWVIFLFLLLIGGLSGEHPFGFRWDNPCFRGRPSPEDLPGEDALIVSPPRRLRPMPEMEKPRDFDALKWDFRKLPFDEHLGPPSEATSKLFEGSASSGFQRAKGDWLDFVSDKPFYGKGIYDVLSGGAGGGGRYGSRVNLKDAVQVGLHWLARHQNDDGSWSEGSARCGRPLPGGRGVAGACDSPGEAAARDDLLRTSLALLAFSGAGYSMKSTDSWDGLSYGDVLARAVRFLSRRPPDPETRALVLLALTSAGETPEELFNTLVADEPAPEASIQAAWKALALLSSAKAGLKPRPSRLQDALETLEARRGIPAWPGRALPESYLTLLGSFEVAPTYEVVLPSRTEIYPLLRAGQARDVDACREGSWAPVAGEGRVMTTIFHLLALESLSGYNSRLGYPVR